MNSNKKNLRILFTMFGWNEEGGGTMFPKNSALRLASKGNDVGVFYAGLSHPENTSPYHLDSNIDRDVQLFGVFNRPAPFTNGSNPLLEIEDLIISRISYSL